MDALPIKGSPWPDTEIVSATWQKAAVPKRLDHIVLLECHTGRDMAEVGVLQDGWRLEYRFAPLRPPLRLDWDEDSVADRWADSAIGILLVVLIISTGITVLTMGMK